MFIFQPTPPPKPKVKAADQKALYSRFVKAANPSEELGKDCFYTELGSSILLCLCYQVVAGMIT